MEKRRPALWGLVIFSNAGWRRVVVNYLAAELTLFYSHPMFLTITAACLALLGMVANTPHAGRSTEPRSRGLYRTAADFRQRRLTMAVNCKVDQNRLRLNQVGPRPYITAIRGGEEYKLAKAILYGYRDCDGREYRFAANNQHYPILNPGEELLLYKTTLPAVGQNPGYVRLYFSATAEAPIQPLTLRNLKKAFPDNRELHDLLNAHFPAGTDLTAFDTAHGMTKLNWLLQQSQPAGEVL